MGSVRTEAIKKLAKELLQTHHEKFSSDYEANKKSVDELVIAMPALDTCRLTVPRLWNAFLSPHGLAESC